MHRTGSRFDPDQVHHFRPVFQWVEENGIDPARLIYIYLTDLFCHSYPNPPEYPVLWVTDSSRTAPFGGTVEISFDQRHCWGYLDLIVSALSAHGSTVPNDGNDWVCVDDPHSSADS